MRLKSLIKMWMGIYIIFPIIGLINYIIDPFGFNNFLLINNFNMVKEDNTVYPIKYKMPYIKSGGYDTLMLGTSRIGVMNPDVVDTILNTKSFNLSQPASVMPIQLDAFKYALKYNKITHLVYGVDFMSFNRNLKLNNYYVELKEPLKSFKSFSNYDIYLNWNTLNASLDTIINNYLEKSIYYPRYFANGMRDHLNHKQKLIEGTFQIDEETSHHLTLYFRKNGIYKNYVFSDEYMDMFKGIVTYCKLNNIKLYAYISPISVKQFDAIKEAGLQDEFEHFKKELVKVVNYIDFTGHNSISKDQNMFWDSSHLRKEYTPLVMQRVLLNQDISPEKDFGTLVTKENIQKHLYEQKKQYQKIDLDKILRKKKGIK